MSLKHMKSLIVLVVGLLAVGCETPMPEEKKALEQKPKSLRDSVVGEYELKTENGNTYKYIYLDNGIREYYINGKKQIELKWSISNGELHLKWNTVLIHVFRINPDKSITYIAEIFKDVKRTDWLKDEQTTYKKIK